MTNDRISFAMALDSMVGGLTHCPMDARIAAIAIRAGAAEGERELAMRIILAKRASWRAWLSVKQREWQRETRRPSRARHHDSIAIRERYVRCSP